MSPRGEGGPTGWQRLRALFEMTPQERLAVLGILAAVLTGLAVRAWVLRHARAVPYEPAGVAAVEKTKR